jgi:hypothetical protein
VDVGVDTLQRLKQPTGKNNTANGAHSEITHSMIKRNQSDALLARTPDRQKKDMMLRAIAHNIMLAFDELEG